MPQTTRFLPDHPSLEQQKKLAKELLQAYHAGDVAARDRVRNHLPDKQRIALTDAQFVLAREYGFESWSKLKAHIDSVTQPTSEELSERFRRTVETGNAVAVRQLLEQQPATRALINEPLFSFGSPALAHVSGRANLALIDALLEFGADPNRRSEWWPGPWHPLHSANQAVADRLIVAGAVPDACAAAHLGRVDLLRSILAADPGRVHERGGDGQTPLHFASTREVVDLLLERGADIDARDVDHRGTPAQWMLDRKRGGGRYSLAAYLVERGATADIFLASALGLTTQLRALIEADPSQLDQRTKQGEYDEQPPSSYHIYTWTIGENLSPLQVAAQFEQVDALRLLRSYASERQRFVAACMAGDATRAKRLLNSNPGLLDQLTLQDKRALPDAGWGANRAAIDLMLELGFDVTVIGANGGTVLHCAAWEGSVPCVETALRYPAVRSLINQPDPHYGGTPLGWCCHGAANCGNPEADHPGVARLLLAAGAHARPEFQDAPPAVAKVIREWESA